LLQRWIQWLGWADLAMGGVLIMGSDVTGYGERMSPTIRRKVTEYGESFHFWCPGCDECHNIPVNHGAAEGRKWGFDGNYDKPTITPSILVNVGGAHPGQPICHSLIKAGRIEFCGDSTHALAGQTVDLPEFDR
jgi:hypothetical protein